MRLIITGFLLVGFLFTAMPSEAATAQSSSPDVTCSPTYTVIATANIGAGDINYCVYVPQTIQPGMSFQVVGTLTAPPSVLPTFTTAAAAFTSLGCTESGPTTIVPTTNGVVGTQWTATSLMTMTSEQCIINSGASLTIGAVPLMIYNTILSVGVATENIRIDNFNYLCDAPGIAPNAYSTTGTVCNDVLFGNNTVSINNTVPVSINNTIGNITINGNFSLNGTSGTGSAEPQGFNGSLYILLAAIGLALARTAEIRGHHGYRVVAGGIFLMAPLAMMKELERLGFNHMDDTALSFALIFFAIQWCLAVYLFIPKDDTEEAQ